MKKFLVSKTTTDKDVTGISVNGKERKFSKSGHSYYETDPGIARETSEAFGKGSDNQQVIVSEVPMVNKDGIHNYTFTVKKPHDFSSGYNKDKVWVSNGKGTSRLIRREDLDRYLDTGWTEE